MGRVYISSDSCRVHIKCSGLGALWGGAAGAASAIVTWGRGVEQAACQKYIHEQVCWSTNLVLSILKHPGLLAHAWVGTCQHSLLRSRKPGQTGQLLL